MNLNKLKRRARQLKCTIKYCCVYLFTKIYRKNSNYWLIAERGNDARDNGYVFYKYLKVEHPEIALKFAITESSPDYHRVDKEDIVKCGSFRHYWMYITSPMLLSTHYQGYSPNFELFAQLDKRGLIKVRGKKILLDHCVRMGKAGCTKATVKIDMMVCSIQREFDALSANAGYDEGVLQNMGMPRFDNLYKAIGRETKNQILFMPTWRVKYTNATENEFIHDEYFRACRELLESKELSAFLDKYNLNFVFYPHIEMQKYVHLFKPQNKRILIREAGSAVVEDLLLDSQVLITDYSSVFFDFAYMQKPVIYFHFDNDENEKAKGTRWFDFERDGLGPICYSVSEVVNSLTNINLNKMSDIYIQRANNLFLVKDDKNCDRVFEAISKLGLE